NDAIECVARRLSGLVPEGGGDGICGFLEFRDGRSRLDGHALYLEGFFGECRNLRILDGKDPAQHPDHRHISAERVEEARALDPDRARADDQQLFRHPIGNARLLVGPNEFAVRLQPRQGARPRAGRENDMLCADCRDRLAVFRDLDFARAGELAVAIDDADLVLLQEMLDSVRELLRYLPRALDGFLEINARALDIDAEGLGLLDQRINIGRAEQRLGRDAAPVEADTAKMLALDNRRL